MSREILTITDPRQMTARQRYRQTASGRSITTGKWRDEPGATRAPRRRTVRRAALRLLGSPWLVLAAAGLALFATAASADLVVSMPNDAGGVLELHDTPVAGACYSDERAAKSWANNANDLYGCWSVDATAGTVNLRWFTGDGIRYRTYRRSDFTRPTPALPVGKQPIL